MIPALIRLARPTHWVKNGFVAGPLIFANPESIGQAAVQSVTAVAVFSLMASAIYCFNDVLDAESDRAHPTKRTRPIAAGLDLAGAGGRLGVRAGRGSHRAVLVPVAAAVLAVLGAYVVNNVLYNARVKTVAIADVISIATGFVLRLVAGAIAIGVVASSWLLVCSFSLALFLGFGKRRSELALAEQGRVYRPVLSAYTPSTLDSAMGISATLTLMCYMLYTIAPETRETHGTGNLMYTVPPVFYAMFRFIFKVQDARGESPEELLLRDRVMLLTAGAWVGLVLLVLKFRGVIEAFGGSDPDRPVAAVRAPSRALAFASMVAAACGGGAPSPSPVAVPAAGFPRTVTDGAGRSLRLAARPVRIVAQTLASDEMLFPMVAPERLVGFSSLSRDPKYSNVLAEATRIRHRQSRAPKTSCG